MGVNQIYTGVFMLRRQLIQGLTGYWLALWLWGCQNLIFYLSFGIAMIFCWLIFFIFWRPRLQLENPKTNQRSDFSIWHPLNQHCSFNTTKMVQTLLKFSRIPYDYHLFGNQGGQCFDGDANVEAFAWFSSYIFISEVGRCTL